MKNMKKQLALVWVVLCLGWAFLSSCQKTDSIDAIDTDVVGTWQLDAITYGLTQVKVQGAKLPYTETRTFSANGDYTISRDNKEIQTGQMFTGESTSNLVSKQVIYYKEDNTYQAYELTEGRLLLYERTDQGAVIADGSTYEYKRQ